MEPPKGTFFFSCPPPELKYYWAPSYIYIYRLLLGSTGSHLVLPSSDWKLVYRSGMNKYRILKVPLQYRDYVVSILKKLIFVIFCPPRTNSRGSHRRLLRTASPCGQAVKLRGMFAAIPAPSASVASSGPCVSVEWGTRSAERPPAGQPAPRLRQQRGPISTAWKHFRGLLRRERSWHSTECRTCSTALEHMEEIFFSFFLFFSHSELSACVRRTYCMCKHFCYSVSFLYRQTECASSRDQRREAILE